MYAVSFRARVGAALLALCLLAVCMSPPAFAEGDLSASLAVSETTVYGGTRLTLKVTLSAPAPHAVTVAAEGAGTPLAVPVAKGASEGILTVAAGTYDEQTAETYALKPGKGYTPSGGVCEVTVLPVPKLSFVGRYYLVTAGRSVPINVSCRNPESLTLPLPVSVKLSDGATVASFTLDSRTPRATPSVRIPKDWRMPCYLSLVMDASGRECGRIPVKVVDSDRQHGVRRVETDENKIAVSFDCGSESLYTNDILDMLDEYGVKATFFVTGEFVNRFPETVTDMHNRGHEIGNHTMSHTNLTALSEDEVYSEITELGDRVEELTGVRPVILHPPYGAANIVIIQTCNMAGCELVYRTWDSGDTDPGLSAGEIISRATDNVSPGSIVLFHGNAPKTGETLRVILETYKAMHLEPVPVSELMYREHYTVDKEGVQRLNPDYRRVTASELVGEQTFTAEAAGLAAMEVRPSADGVTVCRKKDDIAAVQTDPSLLTVTLRSGDTLTAPVKAGDSLGEAVFTYGGDVWFTAPVTAVSDARTNGSPASSPAKDPETVRLGKSVKSSYFFGAGIILLISLFIGAMLMRPDNKTDSR